MVQGSLVGDPLPVSLFLFSSVFCSALHPLCVHQLPGVGLSVSSSFPGSLSFSSLFAPSCLYLALMRTDPAGAGFR